MKLYQIRPLLQDMGRNKAKQDKFSFKYNGVTFDVIVFLEYTPFELLFGIVDHIFSFVLKLHSTGDGSVCSCCLHTPLTKTAHPRGRKCTQQRPFVKMYTLKGSAEADYQRPQSLYSNYSY